MKLIRHLSHGGLCDQGSVLTIGNFDGVHRGHQAVLNNVVRQGRDRHLPVLVMVFEPQPMEFFLDQKAPPRLSTIRDKIELLGELSIDGLVVLPFNHDLASHSAQDFVQRILCDGLRVNHLVVGDDFRFGHARQGDFHYLQTVAPELGFTVEDSQPFLVGGARVSSTKIRECLAQGDLDQVTELLGRPYQLSGRVIHGDKRGRGIGFPTANIRVKNRKSPIRGVFAVTMCDARGVLHQGVANVGTRPTVDDRTNVLLEVHLFDFNQDLYGQRVEISFLSKIRDERKFTDFEALKTQILLDSQQAKTYFKHQNHS